MIGQYKIPQFLEESFRDKFSYTSSLGKPFNFYCHTIGSLKVTDGKIIACDPYTFDCDLPFDTLFPIGSFPVQLAVARINDVERVGFSRIKFSDKDPIAWTMAVCKGQNLSALKPDELFGYGVDTGAGSFMDQQGANEFHKFLIADDNNSQLLADEMAKNYKPTWEWFLWEKRGLNVAIFTAGWGDGVYASYIGADINGNICRLVTDFAIL